VARLIAQACSIRSVFVEARQAIACVSGTIAPEMRLGQLL
jgi:hypothetical protein